jgi:hypothetical protein
MTVFEMPRKDTKLRLDDRILAALREKAIEDGMSFNALCESILFSFAKGAGKLPIDAEPLTEGRGGKRPGAGKPKRSPTDSADADLPETTGERSGDVDAITLTPTTDDN